jgi:hypothetical protein
MANECVPYYEPGAHVTGRATADVVGMTFAALDAADPDQWAPEGLKGTINTPTATAIPNVIPVVTCGAGGVALGIFQRDVADGALVTIMRQPGMVAPVRSGAAIAAGAAVQSDATGRAITLAAGVRIGVAWSAATAAGQLVAVELD